MPSLIEIIQRETYYPLNDLARHNPRWGRLAALPVVLLDISLETIKFPFLALKNVALAVFQLIAASFSSNYSRTIAVENLKVSYSYIKQIPGSLASIPGKFLRQMVQSCKNPAFAYSVVIPRDTRTSSNDLPIPQEVLGIILSNLGHDEWKKAAGVSLFWRETTLSLNSARLGELKTCAKFLMDNLDNPHAHQKNFLFQLLAGDIEFDLVYPQIFNFKSLGIKRFCPTHVNLRSLPLSEINSYHFRKKEMLLHLLRDLDESTFKKLDELSKKPALQNFIELAKIYRKLGATNIDKNTLLLLCKELANNNFLEKALELIKFLDLDSLKLVLQQIPYESLNIHNVDTVLTWGVTNC